MKPPPPWKPRRRALPAWSETLAIERARVLFKFRELLLKNLRNSRRWSRGATMVRMRASASRHRSRRIPFAASPTC
jgi:hypothetical protein